MGQPVFWNVTTISCQKLQFFVQPVVLVSNSQRHAIHDNFRNSLIITNLKLIQMKYIDGIWDLEWGILQMSLTPLSHLLSMQSIRTTHIIKQKDKTLSLSSSNLNLTLDLKFSPCFCYLHHKNCIWILTRAILREWQSWDMSKHKCVMLAFFF